MPLTPGLEKSKRMMDFTARIAALVALGEHLQGEDEYLQAVMHRTAHHNPWFTKENQTLAISAIAQKMLNQDELNTWLRKYHVPEPVDPQVVGLVMAGNIPLVGFHDVLCVFVAGHKAQIKLSDKDPYLLPYLLKLLERIDPRTANYFQLVEQLADFTAVIATGSNNSARYFETYFKKYPHIIRRNRNGVGVLTGTETPQDLHLLGQDVFRFFGLGCRNVAKVYVPQGYDFRPLLEALHAYRELVLHAKYKHNFDYNYALLILNKVKHHANGCILMTENESLTSRIGMLHFEYYTDIAQLLEELAQRQEEIQCVVAQPGLLPIPTLTFGQTQEPNLWDYPDGVDTLAFLIQLSTLN